MNAQNRGKEANLRTKSEIADFSIKLNSKSFSSWRDAWLEAASFGLLAQWMPKSIGGAGTTAHCFMDMMLTLGQNCHDNGLTMGLNSHILTIQMPLMRFGSEAQISEYLPPLIDGQHIGAFALTEPEAGSDALSLKTTATQSDGGYCLNGQKIYIGMGPVCDIAIVFAQTAPERGPWGLSAFVVHASDEGFIKGETQKKIGLETLPLGQLSFQDCWIPKERLLGKEGSGAHIIQHVLDWERSFILAPHIGAMQRQLGTNAHFAGMRQIFGQAIGQFQSVSNRIADMRIRLTTSELMLLKAAELFDAGALTSEFAAMTNLHISESILSSSMDAFRNTGGLAYLNGHQPDLSVQDAMGGVIYSGTSDIQRQIIAKITLQEFRKSAEAKPASSIQHKNEKP